MERDIHQFKNKTKEDIKEIKVLPSKEYNSRNVSSYLNSLKFISRKST